MIEHMRLDQRPTRLVLQQHLSLDPNHFGVCNYHLLSWLERRIMAEFDSSFYTPGTYDPVTGVFTTSADSTAVNHTIRSRLAKATAGFTLRRGGAA
jgi:hypothetical protein